MPVSAVAVIDVVLGLGFAVAMYWFFCFLFCWVFLKAEECEVSSAVIRQALLLFLSAFGGFCERISLCE